MMYKVLLIAVVMLLGACGRSGSGDSEGPRPADAAPVAAPPPAAPAADPAPAEPPRPEPTPQRVTIPEGGIDAALEAADLALSEQRLALGANSALGLYLAVLDVDPENPRALAGKDATLAALVAHGRERLAQGRLEDTEQATEVLTRYAAGNPEVERLIAELARAIDIRDTLADVRAAMDAGALVGEGETSASMLIGGLLSRYPDLPEGLAAREAIEAQVIAQAESLGAAGRFTDADRLLGDAARSWPGSAGLQDAGARLQEMRHLRATRLFEEAGVALGRRDVDGAERILRQVERLAIQQDEVDELRMRIESVRLYEGRSPGEVVRDALASGGEGPEMVVVPVGAFRMGAGRDDGRGRAVELPVREVKFERGFLLSRTEVTVGQFRRFVEASGYRPTSSERRRSTVYDEKSGGMVERRGATWESDFAGQRADDSLPVAHVSWHDARAYAAWLARETGSPYRLPSEAEFEYALRAGAETPYPWGDGTPQRPVGNLTGQQDRSTLRRSWSNAFPGYGDGFWGPAPAGSFEANAFGLQDLVGNLSEWVEDCWHDSFKRAPRDGSAWVNPGCPRRVYRGSSWASAPEQSRSAFRAEATPETTHGRLGFRVAR